MRISIYCSSASNLKEEYYTTAYHLSRKLAEAGHGLVYGGYNQGIMGAVAQGFRDGQGEIIGVVPEIFDTDDYNFGCTEIVHVKTMSERKAKMEELCDLMLILPGGVGTFDEMFEALVLNSLDEIKVPMAVYNYLHTYDLLIEFLKKNVADGFLNPKTLALLPFYTEEEEILEYVKKIA